MKKILCLGIAATVLFAACNKDDKYDTNNGAGQPQLSYQVKAINTSTTNARSTAGTLTWTSGFANPAVIKFEAKRDNSKLEYTANNAGQIDLFAFDPVTFGNSHLGQVPTKK